MTDHRIRSGSLQFWPRKRAARILPSVNWKPIEKKNKKGLLGFLGYKVGMVSVSAKDVDEDSMTKGKMVVIPGTILECPEMKIFSVRLYKDGKVLKDIVVANEKNLKRKVKVPKEVKKIGDIKEEFDDLRVIVYSGLNKKPNMIEFAIGGSKEEKLNFVKEKVGKGISVTEVFSDGLVDVRGVTRGFGTQGPVKRFGITLKDSKSEKGQRRPGSLSSFGLRRVTFRAPQAGQVGFFSRVVYNNMILQVGKISEKDINKSSGFHKYGKIKTDYIILRGSIPGVKKRSLIITPALRPTKKKAKMKFEVGGLR